MRKGIIIMSSSLGGVLFSYFLLQIMYIIDPIKRGSGFITSVCYVFINIPLGVVSGIAFLYGLYLLIKSKKKGIEGTGEDVDFKDER